MPALSNPKHERFYVYAVRIDGRTRYVGKGCGDRAATHLRSSHNPVLRAEIDAARALGRGVRVRIVRAGLSERDAFRLERRMIATFAHRLTNVSMGSPTSLERVAMEAAANLEMLKSDDQVRREGDRMGVSVGDHIALLRDIRCRLNQLAMAA